MDTAIRYQHKCESFGFWIKRVMWSGARMIRWECGHIELRQQGQPLPDRPLAGHYVPWTPKQRKEIYGRTGTQS